MAGSRKRCPTPKAGPVLRVLRTFGVGHLFPTPGEKRQKKSAWHRSGNNCRSYVRQNVDPLRSDVHYHQIENGPTYRSKGTFAAPYCRPKLGALSFCRTFFCRPTACWCNGIFSLPNYFASTSGYGFACTKSIVLANFRTQDDPRIAWNYENRPKANVTFWPPKPKELLRATFTLASRA